MPPDTYETAGRGGSVGRATIFLTDMMGHSFDAGSGTGTITVDEGAASGTLDVAMTDEETGKTIEAHGTWTCAGL